jgi:uncharacterized protein with NRDE domain
MCTVLVLYHGHPAAPLIVAANRDEFYARPAAPPELLLDGPVRALGGRDLQEGGTWMGLNSSGLFVGLTNYRSTALGRASRGRLALAALACSTPDEVGALVAARASRAEFRPFNLLFGTPSDLRIARVLDDGVHVEAVAPGAHVLVSNAVLDESRSLKARRAAALLRAAAEETDLEALLEGLGRTLADHTLPDRAPEPDSEVGSGLTFGAETERRLQGICVHTAPYGTRSATLAALGTDAPVWAFADGAPCSAPFRRYPELLSKVLGASNQ